MDAAARPVLRPEVSLRPERFGALAYNFGNRRLSFLKDPDLVAVVRSFDGSRTVDDALVGAGVDARRRPAFLAALDTLERSGMIEAMGSGAVDGGDRGEGRGAGA